MTGFYSKNDLTSTVLEHLACSPGSNIRAWQCLYKDNDYS